MPSTRRPAFASIGLADGAENRTPFELFQWYQQRRSGTKLPRKVSKVTLIVRILPARASTLSLSVSPDTSRYLLI